MAYRYNRKTAERPYSERAHSRPRTEIAWNEALLVFHSRILDELYGDMDFVESDVEHRGGRNRP